PSRPLLCGRLGPGLAHPQWLPRPGNGRLRQEDKQEKTSTRDRSRLLRATTRGEKIQARGSRFRSCSATGTKRTLVIYSELSVPLTQNLGPSIIHRPTVANVRWMVTGAGA